MVATEKKLYKKTCPRCGGTGKYHTRTGVYQNICFKCNGSGYSLVKTSPEAREKARVKREEKQAVEAEIRARFVRSSREKLEQLCTEDFMKKIESLPHAKGFTKWDYDAQARIPMTMRDDIQWWLYNWSVSNVESLIKRIEALKAQL